MTCPHCTACDTATHEARLNVRAWFRGYVTRYLAPLEIPVKSKPRKRPDSQYPTMTTRAAVRSDWAR